MTDKTFELGTKAKDVVTGFEGVITGRCSYLTGCDQYLLQPPAKDGEYKKAMWLDANRIETLPGEKVVLADEASAAADDGPCDPAPIK